jgi:hypothetical protein
MANASLSGVTAVYVLLAGAAMLVGGSFVALTVFVYLGRALAKRRAAKVSIPSARVVNR